MKHSKLIYNQGFELKQRRNQIMQQLQGNQMMQSLEIKNPQRQSLNITNLGLKLEPQRLPAQKHEINTDILTNQNINTTKSFLQESDSVPKLYTTLLSVQVRVLEKQFFTKLKAKLLLKLPGLIVDVLAVEGIKTRFELKTTRKLSYNIIQKILPPYIRILKLNIES